MNIVFLGTNGWYDSVTGSTICTLIRTRDHAIVLDAGYGIAGLDRHISDGVPVFLFLSHFHLDHIAGLHVLGKFRFTQGLTICGPTGTRMTMERFVNQPYTMPLAELPYRVTIRELPEESGSLPLPVATAPLRHASLTLGYRFKLEGRMVAYCPDTGYCPEAIGLASGADVLIAECAYLPGEDQPNWPHLNPETAATIAREAQVKQLVLTHFDASRYRSLDDRMDALQHARAVFPNSLAARDGLVIDL